MMTLPAAWLAQLAMMALAMSRIAGMILTSPFPGNGVPTQIKVGLVVVLGWVALGTMAPVDLALDLRLVGLAATEVSFGLLIGLTFRITFSCAEVMGSSFTQSLGLNSAHTYDPMLESDDGVPARIGTMLAMLLCFSLGTHRIALAYLLASFHALPVGHALAVTQAVPLLVEYAGAALSAGVRLGLPVAAVALAVQVTLALVARASPSLQIFSVGLALSLSAGLLALIAGLGDVTTGLAGELTQLGSHLETVIEAAGRIEH